MSNLAVHAYSNKSSYQVSVFDMFWSYLVGEELGVLPPVVVEGHPLDKSNVNLLIAREL